MVKCPKCRNSTQFELLDTWYHEDGGTIVVERLYACECGQDFYTLQTYHSADPEENDPTL